MLLAVDRCCVSLRVVVCCCLMLLRADCVLCVVCCLMFAVGCVCCCLLLSCGVCCCVLLLCPVYGAAVRCLWFVVCSVLLLLFVVAVCPLSCVVVRWGLLWLVACSVFAVWCCLLFVVCRSLLFDVYRL